MVLTAIRCEVCKKQQDFPYVAEQFAREIKLPEDWYILFKGDWLKLEPRHLCSTECLNRWSLLQLSSDKQGERDE